MSSNMESPEPLNKFKMFSAKIKPKIGKRTPEVTAQKAAKRR